MARIGRMRVEGLRELDRALGELPKATGKNVLRRTLRKAGEPIMKEWAARTPVLTGKLQKSVATGTKLSRRQRRGHRKQSTIEIFVGAGALAQATMQEFGTANQAPQPAARPAWDNNHVKALEIVKTELGGEIEAARKRLARKAAREAAKIGAKLK